jgi:hypothetical protein
LIALEVSECNLKGLDTLDKLALIGEEKLEFNVVA